jgi:hypothetical protein
MALKTTQESVRSGISVLGLAVLPATTSTSAISTYFTSGMAGINTLARFDTTLNDVATFMIKAAE